MQGKVYLASSSAKHTFYSDFADITDLRQDDYFAVKVYDKSDFKTMGALEFNMLKNIKSHPNIVEAYYYKSDAELTKNSPCQLLSKTGTTSDKPNAGQIVDFMTMEYCPHGDVFELVKKCGKLEKSLALHIFKQVLHAMEYLHE